MSKPIRVLALVTDAYGGRGGIAQYNRDFIEAIARHPLVDGVDVLPRVAIDSPQRLPVRVRQFGASGGRLVYAIRAAKLMRQARYDLIYNGHLYIGPLSATIGKVTSTPIISQLHGTEIWTKPAWYRRKALECSKVILCVSRDTRARTLSTIDIDPERLIVLPNTVHPTYTLGDREGARRRFGVGNRRTLSTVGRLDTRDGYKGHDRVIDAMPELLARDPDLLYLVAGEGNDKARLEQRALDLNVQGSVRFLGYVPHPELPDLYRASDVFVLPSTGEGFGIVYLEAMACGTPAVGLGVGGAKDPLCDGQLGHIAETGTLAQTIWAALLQPNDREELASSVINRFGPAIQYQQIHSILQAWLFESSGNVGSNKEDAFNLK